MKLVRAATVLGMSASLVGGSLLLTPSASAQCGPDVPAVSITGGTVVNDTVIDINANGGVGIADASGGNNNVAFPGSDGDDLTAEIASSGNGGVASAAANGGAVSLGDVNSGGNAGNAIAVGDTTCAPIFEEVKEVKPEKPKDVAPVEKPVYVAPEAPADNGGGGGGGRQRNRDVVALPSTGAGAVGGIGAGLFGLAAAAAAVAGGLGLRRRG